MDIGKSFAPVEYLLARPGSFGGLGPYSQNFIFFATFKWAQKIERYITLGWIGLPGTNTSFLGPFVCFVENYIYKIPLEEQVLFNFHIIQKENIYQFHRLVQ